MSSAGELKIAGVADLGGLGDNEGPAVVYRWTAPNPLAVLLPWLGVLLLLLLTANRTARACWVWAPLGGLVGAGGILPAVLASWPSKELGILEELVGSSAVIMLTGHLGNGDGFARAVGEFAVATSLAIAAALALAGLRCRRRYRPVVLCVWVLVLLLPAWLPVMMLWLIFDALSMGFTIDTHQIMAWCQGVAPLVGLSFTLLLPFLILSFANPLYRERLRNLLRLSPSAPPPTEGRSG